MQDTLVRRAIVALWALSSVACYSYAPVHTARVAPGTRVAIDLTVRGQADYERKLGSGVERIEGVLATQTPDSAQVQVRRTRSRNGAWTYWDGEAVDLSTDVFAKFQERKLSLTRTAMAAGSVALVAVEMLTGSLIGIGGHDRDPNPRPLPPVQPGLRR
jgi:hypothetical protein